MNISACGLICDECQFFQKECEGCYLVEGKPFWTVDATTTGICSLYDCSVNRKGFGNCGLCIELPCQMFLELIDPASSDEEHRESIKRRVKILRGQ